jgi:hypothetical protein
MAYEAINLQRKFSLFDEGWKPKVVAEMNDYQLKVVKLEGDFFRHDRQDTDETFIVVEGCVDLTPASGHPVSKAMEPIEMKYRGSCHGGRIAFEA